MEDPAGDASAAAESGALEAREEPHVELLTFEDLGVYKFSPWAPRQALNMDKRGLHKLAQVRVCWFAVLVICYVYAELSLASDEELTSGLRQEIVDEFFPDAGKASVRLKEGEVTPGVKERMHADDVAQVLNWYTTLCRTKASADDHIHDVWRCRLSQVVIGKPHTTRWDPFHNRGLPDDVAENPKATGKKMNMYANFPYDRMKVDQSLDAIEKVCSQRFLSWHLGRGDDPGGKPEYSQVHARFGDMGQFQENILSRVGINERLDDIYDEFTILDDNLMFSNLSAQMNEHLGLTDGLSEIDDHLYKINNHVQKLAKTVKQMAMRNRLRPRGASLVQLSTGSGRTLRRGMQHGAGVLDAPLEQVLREALDVPAEPWVSGASEEAATLRTGRAVAFRGPRAASREFARLEPARAQTRDFANVESVRGGEAATVLPGGLLQKAAAPGHANAKGEQLGHGEAETVITDSHPHALYRKGRHMSTSSFQSDWNASDARKSAASTSNQQHKERKEAEDEADAYGTGCFEALDIVGMLLDEYIERDVDHSGKLDRTETLSLLCDILGLEDNEASKAAAAKYYDMLQKTPDKMVTAAEYLKFATKHSNDLKLRARGFLSEECRNHHWGLLNLCKPDVIEADFRVQNIKRDEEGVQVPKSFLDVVIRFDAVGKGSDTGWYQAKLSIEDGAPPSNRDWKSFLAAMCTLVLVVALFLVEFIITVCRFPGNLLRLKNFGASRDCISGFASAGSRARAWKALCRIFKSFLDGREARLMFVPAEFLLVELLAAIAFLTSVCTSVSYSLMPAIVPMGKIAASDSDLGKKCMNAFIEEDVVYAHQLLNGEAVKRGLSPYSYMENCLKYSGDLERFGEIMYELIFAHSFHAFVIAIVSLRLFHCFEFHQRMSWLPHSIKIAASKLGSFIFMYFMIVAAFAMLMRMSYGQLYSQYTTFSRSFEALMLYSFGMTERATYGLHPFIETSGTVMTGYLFVYTILIVTIGLNFFTTIILDAFARVSDPDFDPMEIEVLAISGFSFLGPYLGVPDEIFEGPSEEFSKKRKTSILGT